MYTSTKYPFTTKEQGCLMQYSFTTRFIETSAPNVGKFHENFTCNQHYMELLPYVMHDAVILYTYNGTHLDMWYMITYDHCWMHTAAYTGMQHSYHVQLKLYFHTYTSTLYQFNTQRTSAQCQRRCRMLASTHVNPFCFTGCNHSSDLITTVRPKCSG